MLRPQINAVYIASKWFLSFVLVISLPCLPLNFPHFFQSLPQALIDSGNPQLNVPSAFTPMTQVSDSVRIVV